MASNPHFVLLLSFTTIVAVACGENVIELGSLLAPKGNTHPSSWASSSGHFAFGFYPQRDGYTVGIWVVGASESEDTVVWTANRDDPVLSPSSTLQFTKDGVILGAGGGNVTSGVEDAGSACMLDSGNFVIYGKANGNSSMAINASLQVLWQSFEHPTDTILGGQNLSSGSSLVSSMSKTDHSSGRFYLIMHVNNSLDAYPAGKDTPYVDDVYWSYLGASHSSSTASSSRGPIYSNSSGSGVYSRRPHPTRRDYTRREEGAVSLTYSHIDNYNVSGRNGYRNRGQILCSCESVNLSLSLEGSLCLIDYQCLVSNTNFREKSHNTTSIYRATLDFDGNFRLYEHQFEAEASANSVVQTLWEAWPDECQINGFCGLNSYCSNETGKAVCICYPGFAPSANNVSNTFLECKLNYSKRDCEASDDPISLYNVTFLEDMWWGDLPYFLNPTTMEECGKSCKEDCDCGAALYVNSSCNKYRLPLRYGRKTSNASAMALFKVPLGYANGLDHAPPRNPEVVVDNKTSLILTLSLTLGCISLFCVVFAVYIFFIYRRQVHTYSKLSASSNLGFTECSLRSFSFDELVKATGGFTEEVGRGSFGAVYRGTIGDGNRTIAVKRLEKIVDEGEKEFRAEIKAIARTHHRNLVKLIGYCIDGSRKLLVYEYLSNGSLANLLFKGKNHLPLKEKIKMALDVARGVQYLHEECEVRIIHCNLKPQNILMDEAWSAKISDFGFARLLKPEHSRAKAGDEGISGYLAPEWQKEASLISVKADIYSYGVVLLEIVCRRRNIQVNVSSKEEVLLSSWVYQCFAAGRLNELVACDIDEDEDEKIYWKTVERMVKVGLWCVQDDPSLRPSMKNVILMLEGWKDTPIPPSPSL